VSAPRPGKRLTQRELEAQRLAHSLAQLREPVLVVNRYPRTQPVRARQLVAGDVLEIERGAPLVVLEVQPARRSGLLMSRVRSVEVGADGPTRFAGPFLPDQIVQRAVRH
jgi:hypothetical protein